MDRDGGGPKYVFASADWVQAVDRIVRGLAAERGREGDHFTLLEHYTAVPCDIDPSGRISWHARVNGKEAEAGLGEIEGADVVVTSDYATALPVARLVYTPEILAEREAAQAASPSPAPRTDPARAPAYLDEVHNRIAAITA